MGSRHLPSLHAAYLQWDARNRIDDLFQPITSLQDCLAGMSRPSLQADRTDIKQLERPGVSAIVAATEPSVRYPYLKPRSHHPELLIAVSIH
jgi:hypothetical protein